MATLAPTTPWTSATKDDYRDCPVTTLKVDMHTERLIIANAVMAVVTLALGGLAALLIALTRWTPRPSTRFPNAASSSPILRTRRPRRS